MEDLRRAGHDVVEYTTLETGVQDVDILYVTRTQEERFPSPEEANPTAVFRLNQSIYTQFCAPNTVIMHPPPGLAPRLKSSTRI